MLFPNEIEIYIDPQTLQTQRNGTGYDAIEAEAYLHAVIESLKYVTSWDVSEGVDATRLLRYVATTKQWQLNITRDPDTLQIRSMMIHDWDSGCLYDFRQSGASVTRIAAADIERAWKIADALLILCGACISRLPSALGSPLVPFWWDSIRQRWGYYHYVTSAEAPDAECRFWRFAGELPFPSKTASSYPIIGRNDTLEILLECIASAPLEQIACLPIRELRVENAGAYLRAVGMYKANKFSVAYQHRIFRGAIIDQDGCIINARLANVRAERHLSFSILVELLDALAPLIARHYCGLPLPEIFLGPGTLSGQQTELPCPVLLEDVHET